MWKMDWKNIYTKEGSYQSKKCSRERKEQKEKIKKMEMDTNKERKKSYIKE